LGRLLALLTRQLELELGRLLVLSADNWAVPSQTTGAFRQGGGGLSTSSTGLSGTLSLSYDLYTSGQRRASIRRAEQQLRFDELDVERQIEQLRLDVANDYALQAADESVRINQLLSGMPKLVYVMLKL